ncbi:hypothetical protein IS519_21625 [Vibrio crassostreae]|uniref:hypothetical protein n=1 Tax=Vibrio crassostreae TaxID=246167 RepID=UPI00200B3411|nr:hypothetical protein [Vibrio crassostreae]UPR31461.1 hypothetical protein IS519_21625 [Vibrio crassostreae]
MKSLSSPLPASSNGAVQVFSPSKEFSGTDFTVAPSTVFSPLSDVVVTYDNGNSITVREGEIIGVPNGVYEMTLGVAAIVRFAGIAKEGHSVKVIVKPESGHTFESVETLGYSIVTDGTETAITWFDSDGGEIGTTATPTIAPTMTRKIKVVVSKDGAPSVTLTVNNTPHADSDTFYLGNENGTRGDWEWTRGLGDGSHSGMGNRATFFSTDDVNGSNVSGCTPNMLGSKFESPVKFSTGETALIEVSASPINDGKAGSVPNIKSSTFGIYIEPTTEIIESFGYPQPFFLLSGAAPE